MNSYNLKDLDAYDKAYMIIAAPYSFPLNITTFIRSNSNEWKSNFGDDNMSLVNDWHKKCNDIINRAGRFQHSNLRLYNEIMNLFKLPSFEYDELINVFEYIGRVTHFINDLSVEDRKFLGKLILDIISFKIEAMHIRDKLYFNNMDKRLAAMYPSDVIKYQMKIFEQYISDNTSTFVQIAALIVFITHALLPGHYYFNDTSENQIMHHNTIANNLSDIAKAVFYDNQMYDDIHKNANDLLMKILNKDESNVDLLSVLGNVIDKDSYRRLSMDKIDELINYKFDVLMKSDNIRIDENVINFLRVIDEHELALYIGNENATFVVDESTLGYLLKANEFPVGKISVSKPKNEKSLYSVITVDDTTYALFVVPDKKDKCYGIECNWMKMDDELKLITIVIPENKEYKLEV